MKNNIYSIFFSVLLSSIIYHLGSLPVAAQQVSLSLTPPLIESAISPGKSIMIAYNLKNNGDPTIINTRVVSFSPMGNLGNIQLKDEATGPVRFSLDNSFLQLNNPFILKTSEAQQLLLRIRVPDGAPNGDYYYTLLAETQAPPTTEGTVSTRAKAAIGANILVTVTDSGVVEINPKITLFATKGGFTLNQNVKIFDSFDKIPVVLYVQNKGNNLIKPEGSISLKGNFGETANFDIVPKNILAQSERLIEATPSSSIDCNGPSCNSPTSVTLSGFFIGTYQLSTNIGFGENSPSIFASTIFYAFPFKVLIGLFVTIAISVYIIKRLASD